MRNGLLWLAPALWALMAPCHAEEWRPVVLMHGLLANASKLDTLKTRIAADFPGIYVRSVEITTKITSLTTSMNVQVERFAAAVRADPRLARGFNLVGHSQGGLITRGYVERHNDPPVHNLISLAGPQAGQYGVPEFNALCPDHACPWLDELMRRLLDEGATAALQEAFSFASYWRDPKNLSNYLATNIFLADLNNERTAKNATYKANMLSLNAYGLLFSTGDDICVPRETPWFAFFADGSDQQPLVPMEQSAAYEGDWIGLRTLAESGRLVRWQVDCPHGEIPQASCLDQSYVPNMQRLLNNTLP